MAKERKASVIYGGNASQLVYAFPFDYLRKKFVKVEDIYTNITELTMGVDYTVEDKQVRLVKGIPLGHSVKIYRETTTAPLVEWQDASVLRSADLSLQEVQLLHLAEETADKVFDSGMSTAYDNPNCWDGQYKRIINALDPIEDGDVVTLRYIKANQDSRLNQLKNTGAAQNASIVSTGDAQNKRLTDTGDSYVATMTTLKNTATDKATEATNQAALAKKWAVSDTSPDGTTASKSSKTWAEAAKVSASNSASSALDAHNSAVNASSRATDAHNNAAHAQQEASASANSATAAATSASNAATSATNAKASETKAASSASAAAQSAENAKTWDPTQYVKSVTELNGIVTVTKGDEKSTTFNVNKALNDFIASRTLKVGSTVELGYLFLDGFITSSGTAFCFTIPLNKISTESLEGTITGRFFMRQAGKYMFDGNDDWLNLNEYFTINTCIFNKEGCISVIMNPKKAVRNVKNNAEFSIEISDLTFRAERKGDYHVLLSTSTPSYQ